MDDRRFDDLTRRLATGTSRRQVLKTLAGGALGGLAGALGLSRASAAGCNTDAECGPGETCDPATGRCLRRGGGDHPASQQQTQSVGIAIVCTTDADCAPNETCVDSVCIAGGGGCTRGSTCLTDATCCGGEVCDTPNQICVGAGGPCTNDTGTCFDTLDCCGNEECVGGLCQQTAGGCAPGAVCAVDAECCGGQVCVNATCAQAARPAGCPEGQVRCNGVCVDIFTDPSNCGGCGATCSEGLTCVAGVCTGTIYCTVDEECPACQTCAAPKPGAAPRCMSCDTWLGPCYPCGVDGRCPPMCPGCDECVLDEAGGATCRGECPPCHVCNEVTGTCEFACGLCESCVGDEFGNASCVPRTGACEVCDPGTGAVSSTCGACEQCRYDTGIGDYTCKPCSACATCNGIECISNCTDPCTYCGEEGVCIDFCTAGCTTCMDDACVNDCTEGQVCDPLTNTCVP